MKGVPRISLDYPNGRSHLLDYEGPQRFHVGQEFELYGRRWRVSEVKRVRDTRAGGFNRVIACVPLTGSALLRRSDVRAAARQS